VRTIRSGQNERYERRTGPYIRASSDWRGRASSLGSRGEACPRPLFDAPRHRRDGVSRVAGMLWRLE